MDKKTSTKQSGIWEGNFGKEYTDRNPQSVKEFDALYLNDYGISRSAMNKDFLSGFFEGFKILEVGANIGLELELLRNMGFHDLLGVEINPYAVLKAKHIHPEVDVIRGSAFDLPFRDAYFDMVFTSGVLIHISPHDIRKAMHEIYRVSKKYIWGFEYFASTPTEVQYRGSSDLLWKQNFLSLYRGIFPELKLVKEKKYAFRNSENFSQMFLLEKIHRNNVGI